MNQEVETGENECSKVVEIEPDCLTPQVLFREPSEADSLTGCVFLSVTRNYSSHLKHTGWIDPDVIACPGFNKFFPSKVALRLGSCGLEAPSLGGSAAVQTQHVILEASVGTC